jgi:PAS domain S-box-containing protein
VYHESKIDMESIEFKIFSLKAISARNNHFAKWLLIGAIFTLYMLFFPMLHQVFGWISVSFSWCYIGLAVWFWGVHGAVPAAVFGYFLNVVLLKNIGGEQLGGILALILSVSIAAILGKLRDLSVLLQTQLSEREEIEKQILNKERLLISEVLYWVDSLVVVIDLNGYIVKFNRSSEKLSGYIFDEVQDKPFWDIFVSADERDGVKSAITDVIEKGLPESFQNFWVTKDGSKRLIDWVNSTLKKPDGSTGYILCTGRDITEQKKAEEALRENEKKYRELVQHANSIILRFDTRGRITFFNEFSQSYFGYTEDEILHQNIVGSIVPQTESSGRDLKAMFKNIVRNPWQYVHNENEVIKRSGERVWVAWTNKAILGHDGNISEFLSIGMDITARRRATQALQESEKRFRVLFEQAPEPFYINKMDGTLVDGNKAAEKMLGYKREELIGTKFLEIGILSEQDVPKALNLMKQNQKGDPTGPDEFTLYRKDGVPVFTEISTIPVDIKGEEFVLGIARDMTDHRQAQEALRLSEEKFSKAFQTSPVWVSISTVKDDKYLEVNDAFTIITGFTKEETIGRTSFDLNFWSGSQKDRARAIIIFRKQGYVRNFEIKMRFKDGQIHDLLWSADSFESEGEDCLINVFVDITDLKKLQEENLQLVAQLQHTQKMEAIGTLAGGIAHDFNNILGAILGYAQLAMIDLPENNINRQYIAQILTASERAKGLVRQILDFSRQSKPEKIPVDIGIIVKEALKLLRASLPANIEIRNNVKSNQGSVMADQTQIHQIMMNLCTNALHAMGKNGGFLEVILVPVEPNTDEAAAYNDLKPGRYLKLTVTDSGCGMDSATIARIFEPYFTTKEIGEGTGLGLSMVHGIVQNHDGKIKVYSEPGAGTSFHILLPCIEVQANKETKTFEPLPVGTENVLFVDDEKVLVDIGEQMLKKLGYKVTGRTSPYEALEAFRANPDKFDLVITDMSMPRMSGEILAKDILKIRSDMPVIICTGFSNMFTPENASSMGIKEFLMKPITMHDLSKSIHNVLDQS